MGLPTPLPVSVEQAVLSQNNGEEAIMNPLPVSVEQAVLRQNNGEEAIMDASTLLMVILVFGFQFVNLNSPGG